MVSSLTESRPSNPHTRPKNRVGGFSAASYSCTSVTWSQAGEPHRETGDVATSGASGIVSWLSKDPIGISGGLNQYVAFANNPVMYRDPFGLDPDEGGLNDPVPMWGPSGPPGGSLPGTLLRDAGNLAGKIWTAPNTAIGVLFGAVNLPFGGSVSFGNNAIQFMTTYGSPDGFGGALTLGNAVLYTEGIHPGDIFPRYNDCGDVIVGVHEEAHTYQYQALGPFYGPAYLLSGGAFTPLSPWEYAADNYADGTGGWWPTKSYRELKKSGGR